MPPRPESLNALKVKNAKPGRYADGGKLYLLVRGPECPRTGHDSAKLYLPPGGTMFLSRRAYRTAYISERGGPID